MPSMGGECRYVDPRTLPVRIYVGWFSPGKKLMLRQRYRGRFRLEFRR